MSGVRLVGNPLRTTSAPVPLADATAVVRFHAGLDGYRPTPLVDSSALAERWGVRRVLLKFEESRFGLPSFKYLGVSWATHRLLRGTAREKVTLVAATDGNHGLAVARIARLHGLQAKILLPAGSAQARIDAVAAEGAEVEIGGSYDDAVRRSAELADERHLVVSDTSWDGYVEVPGWVIEGYATLFREISDEAPGAVDVAFIPIGVGALAATAAQRLDPSIRLVGVEPTSAACMLESALAGRIVELSEPPTSVMAGLNAGRPSPVAWPFVSRRFDAFCAIEDDLAVTGMRRLAMLGLAAGECSGGTFSAAEWTAGDARARADLRITAESVVLVVLTEGVTDPAAYRKLTDARL